MTEIPHFSLPFRFAGPQAAVVEQDSLEEIADCLVAVLTCPQGFRVELPDFGLPDPTFSTPQVSRELLREVVEEWEPRASLTFDRDYAPQILDMVYGPTPGLSPELIDTVRMHVSIRTEE